MFVAYFEAYYKGNFTDRMSTRLAKPEISTTVPDSEIVAAETVLLEFLIDLIDPTPVMGDAAPGSVVNGSTTFYPGAESAHSLQPRKLCTDSTWLPYSLRYNGAERLGIARSRKWRRRSGGSRGRTGGKYARRHLIGIGRARQDLYRRQPDAQCNGQDSCISRRTPRNPRLLLLDPAACQIQCDRTRNLEAALLLDRHESGLGGYDTPHIRARAPASFSVGAVSL